MYRYLALQCPGFEQPFQSQRTINVLVPEQSWANIVFFVLTYPRANTTLLLRQKTLLYQVKPATRALRSDALKHFISERKDRHRPTFSSNIVWPATGFLCFHCLASQLKVFLLRFCFCKRILRPGVPENDTCLGLSLLGRSFVGVVCLGRSTSRQNKNSTKLSSVGRQVHPLFNDWRAIVKCWDVSVFESFTSNCSNLHQAANVLRLNAAAGDATMPRRLLPGELRNGRKRPCRGMAEAASISTSFLS